MIDEIVKPEQPKKLGWFRKYVLMQDISPDPKVRQMRGFFWMASILFFLGLSGQFSPSLFMKQYFAGGKHLKMAEGKLQAVLISTRRGQKSYNPVIYINNQPIGLKSFYQCGDYNKVSDIPVNHLVRVWYMDGAIYQMEDVATKKLLRDRCSVNNFIQLSNNATNVYIKLVLTQIILIIAYCYRFNKFIRMLGDEGVTEANKPIRMKWIWLGMRFCFYNFLLIFIFCGDLFPIFNFIR